MTALLMNRLYESCFDKQAVWQLYWQTGCMTAVLTNRLYDSCIDKHAVWQLYWQTCYMTAILLQIVWQLDTDSPVDKIRIFATKDPCRTPAATVRRRMNTSATVRHCIIHGPPSHRPVRCRLKTTTDSPSSFEIEMNSGNKPTQTKNPKMVWKWKKMIWWNLKKSK